MTAGSLHAELEREKSCMLTPNDVANHHFSNVRFGGYRSEEVRSFQEQVAGDYAALYRENATLKRKMKFLVQKLNEYQSGEGGREEEAARQSCASAKEAADKLLCSARAEREAMLAQARLEAEQILAAALLDSQRTEDRVQEARQSVVAFSAGMRELVAGQRSCLEQKAEEMSALFAREQRFLEKQTELLRMLEKLPQPEAEEPAAEAETVRQEPEKPVEKSVEKPVKESVCQPEASIPEPEEPTLVVDMSCAGDRDYDF